jgi:hypothetical protein
MRDERVSAYYPNEINHATSVEYFEWDARQNYQVQQVDVC